MNIQDGGAAFPGFTYNLHDDGTEQVSDHTFRSPGMSLRDWLAGMAMQGVLSNEMTIAALVQYYGGNAQKLWESIGKDSYSLADAMLYARRPPPPENKP